MSLRTRVPQRLTSLLHSLLLVLWTSLIVMTCVMPVRRCEAIAYDRRYDMTEEELSNLLDYLLPEHSRVNIDRVIANPADNELYQDFTA